MLPRLATLAAPFVLAFSLSLPAQDGPSDLFRIPSQGPQFQQDISERDNPFNRARLTGVVRDMGNHPMEGARVELRNSTTGLALTTTYTRQDGSFEIDGLQVRSYELVVSSGLTETRERMDLIPGESNITVRLPTRIADYAGAATVSVSDLKVPDKARKELRKAEESMNRQKPANARRELTKALEIYPQYGKAHMLLGILNLREHRTQEAASELEAAIRLDPGNPMAFAALGAAYNSLGRFPDSIRSLDSATRLASPSWQVHFEMARARLGLREFPAALEHATKAEEIAPHDISSVHLIKANALIGMRDYPRAGKELEEYLRRSPQGPNSAEARRALDQVKAFNTAQR